jgi:hypothetical protein
VPFSRNGSCSIVSCIFVAAGKCLPCRCLAMYIYSDFTFSDFGRHVTVLLFHVVMKMTELYNNDRYLLIFAYFLFLKQFNSYVNTVGIIEA